MFFTIIRNWYADIFIIEGPSFGAGEAFLIGPVPCTTSEVTWCGGVGRGIDTLSSAKVISTEAGQTISSSLIKSVTLSTDGNTQSISIEEASVTAFNAGFFAPCFTKEVAFRNDAGIGMSNAFSILNDRSIVAGSTSTSCFIPG